MEPREIAQALRRRWVLWVVQAVNVVGIAYGFFYYLPQFRQTPVWLWPFVPDSPFAVLLMFVAVSLILANRGRDWVNLLGAGAMVKVGVWTAVVLVWFPEHFRFSFLPDLACPSGPIFGCGNLNTYLFYLHLGMALEALIVADLLPSRPGPYLAIGGAFLATDVIDYHWPVDYLGRGCSGVFPHTVPCDHLTATFLVTVGLSLLSMGLLAGLHRAARQGSRPDRG